MSLWLDIQINLKRVFVRMTKTGNILHKYELSSNFDWHCCSWCAHTLLLLLLLITHENPFMYSANQQEDHSQRQVTEINIYI